MPSVRPPSFALQFFVPRPTRRVEPYLGTAGFLGAAALAVPRAAATPGIMFAAAALAFLYAEVGEIPLAVAGGFIPYSSGRHVIFQR